MDGTGQSSYATGAAGLFAAHARNEMSTEAMRERRDNLLKAIENGDFEPPYLDVLEELAELNIALGEA